MEDEQFAIDDFSEPKSKKQKTESTPTKTHAIQKAKGWVVWKVIDNMLPAPFNRRKTAYSPRNQFHMSKRVS
jgi:hypothetical protein